MTVKATLKQTEKLMLGNHNFSQLGFSMMITRLKTRYSRDPSPAMLQRSMEEINAFLEKFKSVMANDYAIVEKL